MRYFKVATLACLFGFAALGIQNVTAQPTGDAIEGARVAAELRTMHPNVSTNWTGVLKRRISGETSIEIPISCYIFVESNRWRSVYNSSATKSGPAEKLVVTRYFDGHTEYDYWKSPTGVQLPEKPQHLIGAAANIPFAGSDFLLSDLGTEFLQWPTQLLQPGVMRRGQSCYVLDSINPNSNGGGYAKVRSWIAKDYMGLLQAEAYGANGKTIKEFYAGSFKRVAKGEYVLENMEMSSFENDSRTTIEFDVPQ